MPVLQAQEMSQNGHEERSCPKRPGAAHAARRVGAAGPVRAGQRRPHGGAQQPPLPLVVHLAAPAGRALPHLAVRPVRAAHQRHGHRQHLRAGREAAVLRRGVGAEHPLLPRVASDRPGGPAEARVVGTVCAERVAVLDAAARGAAAGRRGAPRLAHGGRPRSRLYGPHTDLPRASGEAESAPRRLGGVLLSEGHRPLHDRCLWTVRRVTYRELTREVPMRPRRILPESIPEPAYEVWETAPATALVTDGQLTSDRAVVLRAARGEDADRDPHQGHAAVREFVLVAVHGDHVTHDVEAAGGGLIDALRLPAVSAEPAVRPVPEVSARDATRGRGHVLQRVPGEYRREQRVLRVEEQRERAGRPVPRLRPGVGVLRAQVRRQPGGVRRARHQRRAAQERAQDLAHDRQPAQHPEPRVVHHRGRAKTIKFSGVSSVVSSRFLFLCKNIFSIDVNI